MTDVNFLLDVSEDKELVEDYQTIRNEDFTEQHCTRARELRHSDVSYMEIAAELDISPRLIPMHVKGECNCDVETTPIENDKPWTEKDLMKYLHENNNCWHRNEIANFLGCHQETIKNWIGEQHHDLKVIDDSDRTSSQSVTQIHRIGIKLQERGNNDFVETVKKRLTEIKQSDRSLKQRYQELDDSNLDF